MIETSIQTTGDYIAQREAERAATDPRVIAAYELQEQIQKEKKTLEEHQEELKEMLAEIGPYKNQYYSVCNLKRAPRKINMALVRKNFPDLVEKAEPSEKYILQALLEEFGKDTLLRMARDHDPAAYDSARTLSVPEFDKATGDSSKKYLYAGLAYEEKWIEDKTQPYCVTYLGTPIKQMAPSRCRQIREAEGEEDY